MTEFTPQQMLGLVKQVDPHVEIKMRRFGDFYVGSSRIEEKNGPFLRGLYGNGSTPEAAMLDHFNQLIASDSLIKDEFIGNVRIRYNIWWNSTLGRFIEMRGSVHG